MRHEDENKSCTTCMAIGLVIAAIVVGVLSYFIAKALSVWVGIIAFLVLLALGLWIVQNICCGEKEKISETPKTEAPAVAVKEPAKEVEVAESKPIKEKAEEPSAKPAEVTVSTPKPAKAKTAKATPKPAAAPVEATKPAKPVKKATIAEGDYDKDGVVEGANEGEKPSTLTAARGGKADDLKKIKGVGPKLEGLLNSLGFYHFDQIASWSDQQVAWVDANLTGFKGRVSRDEWVKQAKVLASGGETDFSNKVDKGDVY